MRLAPAFLLLMVVGWLRAFGATGGDDLQTTDFSRRWLRDSINPRTGRLILEITNETIVTNMPMTGTGFLHITDDIPDPEARAVDLSTDDVIGNLDILHLDGGLNANVNTFLRGDGKWSVVPANGVTPAGTGFTHNTVGTQDPDARAVDLSTPDVVGNLDVSHLDGGVGASATTYWRGDKKWAPISGASGGTVTSVDVVVPGFMTVSGGPITTAGIITIGLSGSKLPITSVGAPSGNGFGHVTSGIWDPAAKAVDLSTADVTGNLPVTHLNSGITATDGTFWRGDGVWTNVLRGNFQTLEGGMIFSSSGFNPGTGPITYMMHNGVIGSIGVNKLSGTFFTPLALTAGGLNAAILQTNGTITINYGFDSMGTSTVNGSPLIVTSTNRLLTGGSLVLSHTGNEGVIESTNYTGGYKPLSLKTGGAERMRILTNGQVNVLNGLDTVSGYTVGGAAASGNYLRGNGTAFVSSSLLASDLTGTIPIGGVAAPTGTGFGHITGGIWDGSARAVDLSGTDVTGIITPVRVIGPYGGISRVGSLASGTAAADYTAATLTLREANFGGKQGPDFSASPHLVFHYNGFSATQIAMDPADAFLSIRDETGTGYKGFRSLVSDTTVGFWFNGAGPAGKYLRGNGTAFVSSSLLASDLSGTIPIGSVAAPTGNGFGHVTSGVWDAAARAVDLSGVDATGILAAGRHPALAGDVTSVAGSLTTTLANTGVSPGAYGNTTTVPIVTIDSKGRVTSATSAAIAFPAGYTPPTGTGFSHITGGVQDGTARAVDLGTADVTGNLPVSRLNSGIGADTGTFWRGDNTWTNTLGATDLLITFTGTNSANLKLDAGNNGDVGIIFSRSGVNAWHNFMINPSTSLSWYNNGGFKMTLNPSGVLDTSAGYTVGGAAASGKYLRGNGTAFTSSSLLASDLTGSLPPGAFSGGAGASTATFWRGDNTWTNSLSGTLNVGSGGQSQTGTNIRPSVVTIQVPQPAEGTVSDGLFIDAYGAANFDQGTAITIGLKHNTLGEFTSRIVHYGYVSGTRGTQLQLQTHSDAQDVWNPGIFINYLGNVGIGLTNPAPTAKLQVAGTIDSTTGFAIAGTAQAGRYLRGNSTAFIQSPLLSSDLSGNLLISSFNGGAGANATTFWRGDNSWASIPSGGVTPTGTGFPHITGGVQDPAARAVDLSGADATGVLAAARHPALAGDVTSVAGSLTTTLANTAVTPGTYGSATTVPQVAVDSKGRVTSAASVAITFPAGYTPPTGTGFTHITGGVQDPASRAVDLSGADATGILASARVSGPYTGISRVGSLASGTVASDYTSGTLTLREANFASGAPSPTTTPRLVFHHSGFSATQLAMDSVDALLAVRDETGTAYKGFRAAVVDATVGFLYNGTAPTGRYLRGNGTAFVSSSLLASDLSGALPAASVPAYTGDVTSPAGSTVNTLVNTAVTPGTYGSATTVPVVTVDSKGRVTAATTATLTAPPNTGYFPIRTVTGVNTTITDSDYTIIGNASQGVTITFTLPLASTHAGRVYIVKYGVASGGGGQVAIAPQTGDFIDGTGTQGLASLQSLTFQSDGGHQWYTIGERFFSAYPMTARTNNIAAPRSRSAARGRTVTR